MKGKDKQKEYMFIVVVVVRRPEPTFFSLSFLSALDVVEIKINKIVVVVVVGARRSQTKEPSLTQKKVVEGLKTKMKGLKQKSSF